MLSSISPYLKTMLASEYAEGSSRRNRPRSVADVVEGGGANNDGGDDSDDEADAHLLSTRPPSLSSEGLGDLTFRQMTIKAARYSTWRAVLLYLTTGYIDFAPLLSSGARSDQLYHDHAKEEPDLPLPVSPKSVYRLAHLLELPDLEQLAFTAFVSSLTVSGGTAMRSLSRIISESCLFSTPFTNPLVRYVAQRQNGKLAESALSEATAFLCSLALKTESASHAT